MTPETLETWEREAKEQIDSLGPLFYAPNCERIVDLIAEVRRLTIPDTQVISEELMREIEKNSTELKYFYKTKNDIEIVVSKLESELRRAKKVIAKKDEALIDVIDYLKYNDNDNGDFTRLALEALALSLEEERPLSEQTREAVLKGLQEAKEGKFAPDPRGEEK